MQEDFVEEFIEDNLQDFDDLSELEKQVYFEKVIALSENLNND